MTLPHAVLLFGVAILAGALNSVAGGGSFFSFPALVFTGVPAIQANATNTIALWPGSVASVGAYRNELTGQRRLLIILGMASVVGGTLGALVLLHTPPSTFTALIPWLLLLATLLFAVGGKLTGMLREQVKARPSSPRAALAGIVGLQFVIALYGGFLEAASAS